MVRFESEKLLEEYVRSRSEEAFARVVAEHSGLVLATGMRKVGSRAEAEEVMQEVFVMLAKKAGALVKGEVVVSAWLYRQTCRLASNRVRGEVRRKRREEEFDAMTETGNGAMMEEIDFALEKLTEQERELVICRYVEERDYAEMGRRFGMSGEAVRKQVGRAVEKLRVVLEKRGVGISASGLAVALVGLSGPKASAAVVAQVSGVALKEGVSAGGGMFSVVGILTGAMGVSVVMGGVRMMEGEERVVEPVVESERVLKSVRSGVWRKVVDARKAGKFLSEDEIVARLIELDEEPGNIIRQTVIEGLLERIPAERVFPFLDRCHGELSILMEEKVFGDLVAVAVDGSPEETMNHVLELGWFWRIRELRSNLSVGSRGLAEWRQMDRLGANEWFIRRFGEINADGGDGGPSGVGDFSKRRRGRSIFDMSYTAGEEYLANFAFYEWRAAGDEGLGKFAKNFSEERQVMMWKRILKSKGSYGNLFPEEMAERMVRFPDEGIYGEMKEVVWLYWVQLARPLLTDGFSWDETLEEYQKLLPEKYAADFQKACRDEVKLIMKRDEG